MDVKTKRTNAMRTLPAQFVREMVADENNLLNTYQQMDPIYKSIFFAVATQLLDKQIEYGKDYLDISDDYLYYYISDVDGFFKQCDFIEPYAFDELVIIMDRNLKNVSVYGFHFNDMYDYAYVTNDMDIFCIKEYIYENINTPEHFGEQLKAIWYFEEVSLHMRKESIMV